MAGIEKKNIKTIIFSIFVLLGLTTILYSNPYNVKEMIGFIEKHTDLKYKNFPLPDIKTVQQKEICRGVYIPPREECDIAGYYDHEQNIIFISDQPGTYMVADRFEEVVLVHELVHFLQYFNGVYEQVACQQELEQDAFDVQDIYVRENNIDPRNAPDPLFAMIVSNCPTIPPWITDEQ